jgi:hypothetical protein
MRLEHLYVENFQGVAHADLDLSAPITLIAGPNGAGKSSLKEAIGLALGESARVALKKDYGQLITEGQKKAQIVLQHDGVASSFTLPGGKAERSQISGSEFLPYVLNPGAFAALDDKGRRKVLFALTRSSARPADIANRLIERGADTKKVESIKPLLLSGFTSAQEQAKTNAAEARGAWKTLTGENYGNEKAEGWSVQLPEGKAPTSAELDAVMAEHASATAEVEKGLSFLGGLEAKRLAYGTHQTRQHAAEQKANLLDRRLTKLDATEKELAAWEPKLVDLQQNLHAIDLAAESCNCPSCGTALKIVGNQLELAQGLKADVKARSDLALELTNARKAVELLKRTQQNDMTAVAESEAAARDLQAIQEEEVEPVDAVLIERTESGINAMRLKADQLRAKFNALRERRNLFADAGKVNTKAAAYHQDVKDWTLIEKALAPDGIQGEILAGMLKPLNTALARVSALPGWNKVRIDSEMNITAAGRAYPILSESEKWRVDTLVAVVIALQSELRMVVLDRFDVLDMPSRTDCMIGLLRPLAKSGEIETAVICGTLKERPTRLPQEIQAIWISDGIAVDPELQGSV